MKITEKVSPMHPDKIADSIKDSKLQVYEEFSLREKVIIKLVVFLINFIGKKQEGYYGTTLDSCVHDIFFPKIEV